MNRVVIGTLLLVSSGVAHAEFKLDVSAVTQYYFRGLEQTDSVAGQGGLSWSDEMDTFHPYAGLWASNIDEEHGLGQVETNAFAGAVLQWHDFNFDLGARYYFFPDAEEPTDTDNIEPYAGLAIGPIALKAYYSPDYYKTGHDSWYVQAGVTLPVIDRLLVHLHGAMTFGEAQDAFFGGGYDDYAISATYRLPWWDINLMASYVITRAPDQRDRVVGSVSKSFGF